MRSIEPPEQRTPRFPTRTLVLMVLALLSFVWFWWNMHRGFSPSAPTAGVEIDVAPRDH